jgi:predicted CXXCH cytochrome family protein
MAAPSILLLGTLWVASQTAQHPVPLPPDFDPAKCVECHTDKQQGKHVHSAIAMGCTTCHTVETKAELTTISLISRPPELCTTCHQTSDEPRKHQPYAQNQCMLCHDPHTSDYLDQIRKPPNALCLTCHGERRGTGNSVELLKSQKVSAEEFAKIPKIVLDRTQRVGHPFLEHPVSDGPDPLRRGEELSCLSCHLPHAAPLPRLLTEAWKSLDICDRCHQAAKAERKKT